MQDPSTYQQIQPQFPEHEHLKCPRCDSTNTKFCYYNNYNLSQPRHFCKNCRRYWTKGGALRNIPIGGGSRKNTKRNSNSKRSSSSSSSSSTTTATTTQIAGKPEPSAAVYGFAAAAFDQEQHRMMDINGSFSSLLASSGQFGNLMEGLNPNGSTVRLGEYGENNLNLNSNLEANLMRNSQVELQSSSNSESFLGVQSGGGGGGGGGDWGGGNGWPDLAIYTPGSTFQ